MMSGLNQKYVKILPVCFLLSVILLFLPFMKAEGNSYNGFLFVKTFFMHDNTAIFWKILGCVVFVLLPIMGLLLALMTQLLKKRWITVVNIVLSTLYLLGLFISLLGLKAIIDESNVLSEGFMMHDLRTVFFMNILLGFFTLFIAMKSARIHPGYIVLVIMSVIWLFPVFWILMNSLRVDGGFYVSYIIPKHAGLKNYVKVLTDTSKFHYARWYANTLIVAVSSCIVTSFIVLSTAYTISRIRFVTRRLLMNLLLILGMFPSFMSMVAVYYILKGMGLEQSLVALVIVYSAGASLTYYIAKGFFDTIPKSLDEAAYIDGATKWQVFTKITVPLSKPIIIYTILTSFMAPWADYIFASIILGDKTKYYTVALGLFQMISRDNIEKYFTQFAAGSMLIAIPIAALFIGLQKYYVEGLSGSVKG